MASRAAKRLKRRKKPRQALRQDIPKHIKKGDPVLYMLQRIGYKHAKLIQCLVISNPKRYEKKLLDLFKSDAIRMEPKLSPPGMFSRHQVKFGITRNLPQRLNDINNDIFESGVTEWRRISWIGYLIALFQFWWFEHGVKVYILLFLVFCCFWGWIYLTNN